MNDYPPTEFRVCLQVVHWDVIFGPFAPSNAIYSTKSWCSSSSKILPFSPWYPSSNLAQTLKSPIPQLHRAKFDHSWIQSQCRSHLILYLARRIKPHNEVMALCICCLMLGRFLRKTENAPVLDASNGTSRFEDEGSCSACNSAFDQYSSGAWSDE
jgi:hypothetical protein